MKSRNRGRYFIIGGIIVLVVGAVVGWQLYQMRQTNLQSAEQFRKQAEMIDRMRGK